jgi:hypothetical protein
MFPLRAEQKLEIASTRRRAPLPQPYASGIEWRAQPAACRRGRTHRCPHSGTAASPPRQRAWTRPSASPGRLARGSAGLAPGYPTARSRFFARLKQWLSLGGCRAIEWLRRMTRRMLDRREGRPQEFIAQQLGDPHWLASSMRATQASDRLPVRVDVESRCR